MKFFSEISMQVEPEIVKSVVEMPVTTFLCVITLAALGVVAFSLYVLLKVNQK